jgi:hypothetical protein
MDAGVSSRPGVLPAAPARVPMPPSAGRQSAFVPVLLLALAFVAWLGFQCVQQIGERQQLTALQASLDAQEAAAKKVRASVDAVATATAKLAAEGNANARVVVEELRKRGVTINANGGAPKPP